MAKAISGLLQDYMDQEEMYHFEGDRGLDHLNSIAAALGYGGHGFKYGSSLEEFLADNPGAQQAIIEWIGNQKSPEWAATLEGQLPEAGDDEEDEEEGE